MLIVLIHMYSFRLRYRCEELKKKKEEEELEKKLPKAEDDIQRLHRCGNGPKNPPRHSHAGGSPRPEVPQSSDKETSSESNSNGVRNLLSSKETAILDSEQSGGSSGSLQARFPYGDLSQDREEEEGASRRRGERTKSKEIIVIDEASRQQSSAAEQRIRVFDVKRKEERRLAERQAGGGGGSLGGRNRSCDAVHRLVGHYELGPEMVASHPQHRQQQQHRDGINRRLSECNLVTACLPRAPQRPFPSGSKDASASVEDGLSKSATRNEATLSRAGPPPPHKTSTELLKETSDTITDSPVRTQVAERLAQNLATNSGSMSRAGNTGPAIKSDRCSRPEVAATNKAANLPLAPTTKGKPNPGADPDGQIRPAAPLQAAARGPTAAAVNGQPAGHRKETNEQPVSLEIPAQQQVGGDSISRLVQKTATVAVAGRAQQQQSGQTSQATDHQEDRRKVGDAGDLGSCQGGFGDVNAGPQLAEVGDSEGIYATVEDSQEDSNKTTCPPEVIYASVNKRAKQRPGTNGHGQKDCDDHGQKDGKGGDQQNSAGDATERHVNAQEDSSSSKCNNDQGQQDSNGHVQQDTNGNPNCEEKNGGKLPKSYKSQFVFKNPFHGSDDGVASTLM